MRVAIHQPNFIPWLGLFHRISLVDTFIFFDHVQAMGGKSWLSRNRVLVSGRSHWMTMPVRKAGRLGQRVREVEINYSNDVRRKQLRTLALAYPKPADLGEIIALLESLYARDYPLIATMNKDFIIAVCEILGLSVSFLSSSDLVESRPELESANATDLIVGLCQACGANEYISGTGCLDFIDPGAFERVGIKFHFQDFEQAPYPQNGVDEFVSHLSVVDVLCQVGVDRTLQLMKGGVLPPQALMGA